MQLFTLTSGAQTGFYNMSLDEALLETIRAWDEPVLIVRTYCWDEPTLSLGANQPVRDIDFLLGFYGKGQPVRAVVRRPTGGRAILHGADISYSFVTNQPQVLRLGLNASYSIYAGLVQKALETLDLPVACAEQAGGKDYVRSPVCFETHTASDLLDVHGNKLSGSAQLRRAGGLLQHGAAFLENYEISEAALSKHLFQAAETELGLKAVSLSQGLPAETWQSLQAKQAELEAIYRASSSALLANASTTSGSHLEPASF